MDEKIEKKNVRKEPKTHKNHEIEKGKHKLNQNASGMWVEGEVEMKIKWRAKRTKKVTSLRDNVKMSDGGVAT